ncbi:hypothetical protein I6I22_14425 [Stutzerimonas stutzeri]|nr:hypothetical protein CXK90_08125 [Stutzerimonas stutzeri]QQC10039.1 hypothetical protein I6I22_14425 [Stutzerimonas stutzeri]
MNLHKHARLTPRGRALLVQRARFACRRCRAGSRRKRNP